MNREWVDKHEEERQHSIDFVITDIEEYISRNTTLFQKEIDEVSNFIRENGRISFMDMPTAPFHNVIRERVALCKELLSGNSQAGRVFRLFLHIGFYIYRSIIW